MERLLAAAASLVLALGAAGPAGAEMRLTLDATPTLGIADEVRPIEHVDEPRSHPSVGLDLRAGLAGRFLEGGAIFSGRGMPFNSTTSAFGLYAGVLLGPASAPRLSLDGELGMQLHSLGGDHWGDDVQADDVALPYAGATATLWWPRPQRTALSAIGFFAGARFDLAHGQGDAVIQSHCWVLGVLCAFLGDPPPFTETYDAGGYSVLAGVTVRFSSSVGARPAPG